jgi:ABC-2 type transport system permease protein
MRGSVVRQLMLKDWRLYRGQILFSVLGGAIALCVVERGTETTVVVGTVWFFIALILVGTMLPLVGIVGERKNHNLAFLMSLPITGVQYARAKLAASLGMYLVPWLALVAAALLFVEVRGMFPQGIIPMMMILLLLPFIGFSVITAAALIGESEGWSIAANVAVQTSYGLTWYFVSRIPGLAEHAKESRPVWNSTALEILGVEVALVVGLLGLTLFLQSLKRDFV